MSTPVEDKKYFELAEKLLNGTITSEEEAILMDWYNQGQDEPLTISTNIAKNPQEIKERIWSNIQEQRKGNKKPASLLRYLNFKRAAAAIIFLLTVSAVFYLSGLKKTDAVVVLKTIHKQNTVLLPGGNKATLTLANGKVVTLDDASNGAIANQGNANVIKLKSGLLAYEQVGKQSSAAMANAINVLSTPRGGQYQVQLPDGTMVWLNASSSLKYPTFFSGKERVVELTGEGYFEVAKNKDMPFKVKVKDMEVAVLGTHFNIMAYIDESTINTTLLEGSVKINTPQVSKMIVPGEQAQLLASGKINIATADLEETVAWKNGYFQFASADMPTVIRQVKRWYDADIIYSGNIEEHFTGTISRSVDAEKVLKKLQLTGAFKYEIKNKQIFITK